MSGRTLAALALLTVLAVAAAWYVRQPVPEPAADTAGDHFMPGLADRLPSVTGVRARIAGGKLLADVVRDGDIWRVRNRDGYPADPGTLRGTLIALSEARRQDAKTDRPEGWDRLGLQPIEEADAGGVELTLEGLDPAPRVIIGETAGADTGGTYLRRLDGDDGRAWLVSERIERPAEIGDWLDDRLTEIPIQRMRSVEIVARDGEPVRVAREQPRSRNFEIANRPEGRRPLSNSIARSVVRIVSDLRLTDVHPAPAVDLPPRLAEARFETLDGLRIVIEAFAAERGTGPRYIRLRAEAAAGSGDPVRQQVDTLNARFDGWLYAIPEYKFVNMTHTLESVLEDPR
ncbi:DUF4340 domain-containing protein [Halofilum ochraceum]|uniref:DUF4340 domain-containing protein n=1 Tax=Halofilum ochraceum TaxID=1611323 RepID=UPI0008DB1AFF|nr:DUF4340 domain-containing protein [Halofilum ochraceum]